MRARMSSSHQAPTLGPYSAHERACRSRTPALSGVPIGPMLGAESAVQPPTMPRNERRRRRAFALAMEHLRRPGGGHHARIVGAAGALAFLAEQFYAADDLVGLGELVEQQIIAFARRPLDAVGAAGGHPQRRVRALQGLGL